MHSAPSWRGPARRRLHGDLAGILGIANSEAPLAGAKGAQSRGLLDSDAPDGVVMGAKIKMVAGAGFEPAAFRL